MILFIGISVYNVASTSKSVGEGHYAFLGEMGSLNFNGGGVLDLNLLPFNFNESSLFDGKYVEALFVK